MYAFYQSVGNNDEVMLGQWTDNGTVISNPHSNIAPFCGAMSKVFID
jgi:hypothetical protein